MASVDDLAFLGEKPGAECGGTDAGCLGIEARGAEDVGLELEATAGGRVQAVAAADCAELVATELAEEHGEAIVELGGELSDQAIAGSARFSDLAAE
jgi:hypothetical protein